MIKIFKMLEDPESDKDELNARIQWFIYGDAWKKEGWVFNKKFSPPRITKIYQMKPKPDNYTTSLDAAMSIGAEELSEWDIYINQYGDSGKFFRCILSRYGPRKSVTAQYIPDMPRAICHARLQALDRVRGS